jgi:hypothetical protein
MYRLQLSLTGRQNQQPFLPPPQPFINPWDMQQPGYNTMRFGAGPLTVYPEGYNTMPFSANPTTRIYPMGHWQQQRNLWQQGYNTPFTGSAVPTYPMGQHHRNRNYYQNQVPQAYNAPFSVGPTYPMGPIHQHRNRNHQNQVPRGHAAPFRAGPLYPRGQQYTNQQYQTRSQAPSSGPRRNRRKRHRKTEPQTKYHTIHESSGSVVNGRSTGVDPGITRIGASNETRAGKVWRTPSENLLMADCNLT